MKAIPLSLAVVTRVALCVVVRDAVGAYLKFRGSRVDTCHETKTTDALELDTGRAALPAGLDEPELRVTSCSHWPERQDCGQRRPEEICSQRASVASIPSWWWTGHERSGTSREGASRREREPARVVGERHDLCRRCGMEHERQSLRRLWARLWPRRPRPRLVRRSAMRCPHTGEHAEIELMMGPTGAPWHVLRCSMRPECPPICDQACRNLAEAVIGPARALLILPPGEDVPELLD